MAVHGGFADALELRVDRHLHAQAALLQHLGRERPLEFVQHGVHHVVPCRLQLVAGLRMNDDGLRGRGIGRREDFRIHHAIDHGVALPGGGFRVAHGRELARAANQSRQHGGFAQREIGGRLVEIAARGRLHAEETHPK